MDIKFSKDNIAFEKEINDLDRLALDFTSALDKCKIKYVIISGYVAILFGRSRASEDIDLFMEKIDYPKFLMLWEELEPNFMCINTSDPKEAYTEYLSNNTAIRFSKKGEFVPNMEIKFPKQELDFWSLAHPIKVIMNKDVLVISPLELQIPFKLVLGTEKDIEDARYLYKLFKERLNSELIDQFVRKLKIGEKFRKYLS